MDDVDLEEDSRNVKNSYKLWRGRINDCFFTSSGDGTSKRRRFSTFDFSKSTPKPTETSNVVSSAVDVDDLRSSEPSLADSFSGGMGYGEGESPFFRESHGDMVPSKMASSNTEI